MMGNAELIKALRCDGTCSDECPYSNGREWCDEDRMINDAADALEKYQKIENALKLLIDGRGDPVSCNVEAILKGEIDDE